MTDKVQKIREEVEKLKSQLLRGACSSQIAMETRCKEEAYNEVLAILDTKQEEQEEPAIDELEKVVEEIVDPTVLNAYGVKEIANRLRRTMIEPVSKDLEEYSALIADELPQGTALTSNGEFDIASVKKLIIEACKYGAKWQKEQIKELLLSEVLPYFMNGGEADEVVAKLEEVLNQNK